MGFIYKLFDLPVVGNKIKMVITSHTGGMQESEILRKYTKDRYGVSVGMYSYGGCFEKSFNLGGSVTVGRYCSFASNIRYFGANHPMEYVSMSPYFYSKAFNPNADDVERSHLEIGNDCWIGYGVIITSNCKHVGDGAVIAAGSVVTKDVPPYAVVAGTPARIIKYRFDEDTIKLIEKSEWWNYSPAECLQFYEFIHQPQEFCNRIIDAYHRK